ncbi:MAG: EboA domain-containing protein [Chitinophagaceae bacterium]
MEDPKPLQTLLAQTLQHATTPEVWQWLQDKGAQIQKEQGAATLNAAFAAVPRKTGTVQLMLSQKEIETFLQWQLNVEGWTVDRAARVWLLMNVDATDKETYFQKIETLFLSATMNELVALYSALPVLQHPQMWRHRCTEGIRSNIGTVLEAIMCNNVYPSQYLDEGAWNQLLLKAFFTEKPVHQIVGLDDRANKELAHILSDYAHERWAAGRPVNGQLWRCVTPFIDENLFEDVVRLSQSDLEVERQVAALICKESNYGPCKELLQQPALQPYLNEHETWQNIAQKAIAAV